MAAPPAALERRSSARLRRCHRLRASRDFQRVSREGQRAASRSFVVLVALPARGRVGGEAEPAEMEPESPAEGLGRLGLTVSRRVGGAVVRNQVKRRVREWFRTTRRADGGLDVVVIARAPAVTLSGASLGEELDSLVREAAGRVRA